jgi:hypothetical protein
MKITNYGCSTSVAALVSPDAEVQIDAVALPLDLVDLALAVLLAASLEGQHLLILREVLQLSQHLSNDHSPRVAWLCTLSNTSSRKEVRSGARRVQKPVHAACR